MPIPLGPVLLLPLLAGQAFGLLGSVRDLSEGQATLGDYRWPSGSIEAKAIGRALAEVAP